MSEMTASILSILTLGAIIALLIGVMSVCAHVLIGEKLTGRSFLKYFLFFIFWAVCFYFFNEWFKEMLANVRLRFGS